MPISNISNGEAGSSVRTSLNQAIDFVNSLGTPTTVGVSILDSTNPSAVTFLRANADNTVTWLSAADFRTDLGLGSIATQASNAVAITGGTITGLTNLGVSMANNTAMTGFSLGTISDTTSRPLNITQTWNNSGLTATALKVAVTNTSSNVASALADLCAGAGGTTSMFKVLATGDVSFITGATSNRTITLPNVTSGAVFSLKTSYASNLIYFDALGYNCLYWDVSGNFHFNNGGLGTVYFDQGLTITDAKNIALATTTGTKIGTATGQKLGFWNATPVVQQVLATGAGATVDNVISLLQTLGLCKQS